MQTSTVLVTGGTGTLGSLVTPILLDAGRQVRVLSRSSRPSGDGIEYVSGDLLEGDAAPRAVDGVETVLHLAGGANAKSDPKATRNLVRAATRAGVNHLVGISVVGADRVPVGYFRNKLAVERIVADSELPWTMLRAAQFHDLVVALGNALAKSPVVPAPTSMWWQPVDARDVATRIAELTLGEPAGLVPDITGPRVYPLGELIRGYLRAAGKRRLTVPLRLPSKAGRAFRNQENLALEGALVAQRTWEDFLAERFATPAHPS
ncbi:uncharacterized protein YbjT (DUF2867 family) [Haloactinopolyspora alba]|uniref:Uncharacterized protein YbjT (DUF2867 family) n=1 Tax=Haloactinopolyspora alba TaxID=648780 RepID=A0A2P8EGD8_9ACTN|nr:NAD(P)H-binding protein [Haloactinopolyspora alba]PSL08520.1 uncharacterized protein YbjT (DUF2867 family) [Haloactinopolyspora alba]